MRRHLCSVYRHLAFVLAKTNTASRSRRVELTMQRLACHEPTTTATRTARPERASGDGGGGTRRSFASLSCGLAPRRRALPCWHSTRLQGLEIGTSVQVVYVRRRPSAQCLCYCPRNGNSSPTGSRTEDGRARRRRRRRRRPDLDGRPDRATGRMIRPLCLGAPTGLTTRDVSFYLFLFPLPGEPHPSQ